MNHAIAATALSRNYGSVRALDGVSLTVDEGSCWGLVGPNGAGKTTLFSLICGYLRPSSGDLTVFGRRPSEPGALKGLLGVLPQDAALPTNFTVGGLLTHLARLSGLLNPDSEARAALERVGMQEIWSRGSRTLSHGMEKRVALAQALMGRPRLVCLDEPTAGLDPKSASNVRDLLREMRKDSTLLISSHNLVELEDLCDHVAVLERGKLVQSASVEQLTRTLAEFRVAVVRGAVPTTELAAMVGCSGATMETPSVLCVKFDGPAEDIIPRVAALLAQRGVQFTTISRGRKLEESIVGR